MPCSCIGVSVAEQPAVDPPPPIIAANFLFFFDNRAEFVTASGFKRLDFSAISLGASGMKGFYLSSSSLKSNFCYFPVPGEGVLNRFSSLRTPVLKALVDGMQKSSSRIRSRGYYSPCCCILPLFNGVRILTAPSFFEVLGFADFLLFAEDEHSFSGAGKRIWPLI